MMKIEIKCRRTGKVLFSHECENNTVKMTLEKAVTDRASLVGASLDRASLVGARLDRASLDGASLDRASLVGASLVGASLVGARLVGASLDPIKSDFYEILSAAKAEIPYLRDALVNGRVDGSVYEGECACLIGTIANARSESYRALGITPDSSRPAERWFMGISRGDTPETNQISRITVGWIDEFLKEAVA